MQITYIPHTQEDIEILKKIMSEVFREEFKMVFNSNELRKPKKKDERYLSSNQVCELLKISYPTLLKRVKEKSIVGRKYGILWRFPLSQFKGFDD